MLPQVYVDNMCRAQLGVTICVLILIAKIAFPWITITERAYIVDIFIMNDKYCILYIKQHCCGCPYDARSQVISSWDIDLLIPNSSDFKFRGVYSYRVCNKIFESYRCLEIDYKQAFISMFFQ